MKAAIYLRVSTDGQTVENQRLELQRVAAQRDWQIAAEFADEGISGAKGRDQRPAFDKLHKAIVRHEFDVVMAWAVDRLGRSMTDLVAFLGEIRGAGVELYLHQQGLDTSTPAGRAMFQMLGVFSEFERSMIVERVRSGMARARQQGTKSGKAIGRPTIGADQDRAVRAALAAGEGIRATARTVGVSKGTVGKTAAEMRGAASA